MNGKSGDDPGAEAEKLLEEFLGQSGSDSFEDFCRDKCAGRPVLEEALRRRHRECGVSAEPPSRAVWRAGNGRLTAGSRVGDYSLVRQLGRGSMGVVWEAEQTTLGQRVAVKIMREGSPALYFEREGRGLVRAQHPGIVTVLAAGESRGGGYIAQELVGDGTTLRDCLGDLRRRLESQDLADHEPGAGTLGPHGFSVVHKRYYREAAEFIAQVAEAMEAAHEGGVIHRDLKPSNILVTPDRHPKVSDFGLARIEDERSISHPGDLAGTYAYMSPEQVAAKRAPVGAPSDIFSLGVVLYEALTLRRAFDGDSARQLAEKILFVDPTHPQRVRSQMPMDLAVICLKAMEKRPADRYSSMADFAADLRRYLDDEPILARAPGLPLRARKWTRRHPTASAAISLTSIALLLALVLVSVILQKNEDLEGTEVALTLKVDELNEALIELSRFRCSLDLERAQDLVAEAPQLAQPNSRNETRFAAWRGHVDGIRSREAQYRNLLERGPELPSSQEAEIAQLIAELDLLQKCRNALEAARCGPGRIEFRSSGEVLEGESLDVPFGPGFVFSIRWLGKVSCDWAIEVRTKDGDDISFLTPPMHGPNPSLISGWHFRNKTNTGPNEGELNVPQRVRRLIFSPEAGQTVRADDSPPLGRGRIEGFGSAVFTILDYELTPPREGPAAIMTRMRFEVTLSWPTDYKAGESDPESLRARLQSNPGDASLRCNLGNHLLSSGEVEAAMDRYRTAIGHNPELAAAHQGLGAAHCIRGEFDLAEVSLRRAVASGRSNPGADFYLGTLLSSTGREEEALPHLARGAVARPAEASYSRGILLAEAGALEQAEHSLRSAVRYTPNYPEAHHSLGRLLLDQGRSVDARKSLNEALRLRPRHDMTLFDLGRAALASGSIIPAVRSFCAIGGESEVPDHPLRAYEEAGGSLSRGRAGVVSIDAIRRLVPAFEQATFERPSDPAAFNELGVVLGCTSAPEAEQVDAFRQAIRLHPDHEAAMGNLASVLFGTTASMSLVPWWFSPLEQIRVVFLELFETQVRVDGEAMSCDVLIAIGVLPSGKLSVVGFHPSFGLTSASWHAFFEQLTDRGLEQPRLVVSRNHIGLIPALTSTFPETPWQRCHSELIREAALESLAREPFDPIETRLRAILHAPDRGEAERLLAGAVRELREQDPDLATWLDVNSRQGFSVFSHPAEERRRLGSTDAIARVEYDLARYTSRHVPFRDVAALRSRIGMILMNLSSEWEE